MYLFSREISQDGRLEGGNLRGILPFPVASKSVSVLSYTGQDTLTLSARSVLVHHSSDLAPFMNSAIASSMHTKLIRANHWNYPYKLEGANR